MTPTGNGLLALLQPPRRPAPLAAASGRRSSPFLPPFPPYPLPGDAHSLPAASHRGRALPRIPPCALLRRAPRLGWDGNSEQSPAQPPGIFLPPPDPLWVLLCPPPDISRLTLATARAAAQQSFPSDPWRSWPCRGSACTLSPQNQPQGCVRCQQSLTPLPAAPPKLGCPADPKGTSTLEMTTASGSSPRCLHVFVNRSGLGHGFKGSYVWFVSKRDIVGAGRAESCKHMSGAPHLWFPALFLVPCPQHQGTAVASRPHPSWDTPPQNEVQRGHVCRAAWSPPRSRCGLCSLPGTSSPSSRMEPAQKLGSPHGHGSGGAGVGGKGLGWEQQASPGAHGQWDMEAACPSAPSAQLLCTGLLLNWGWQDEAVWCGMGFCPFEAQHILTHPRVCAEFRLTKGGNLRPV